MTCHPQPLPTVALDVVWPETLALFRWNLSAFLTTARGDDPADPDGGLAGVESAIASIDAAAAIGHGFGPWDDAAHTWTGCSLSAQGVITAPPVVAWFNAERGPDSYLDRFPASARPFCERAYSDGVRDGESSADAVAKAARALVDAYGGDVPDWLRKEYDALGAALGDFEAEG